MIDTSKSEDLILSEMELQLLTGYKQARFQLEELKRLGFFRARQNPRTGHIILERVHYQAISSGASPFDKPKKELVYIKSK